MRNADDDDGSETMPDVMTVYRAPVLVKNLDQVFGNKELPATAPHEVVYRQVPDMRSEIDKIMQEREYHRDIVRKLALKTTKDKDLETQREGFMVTLKNLREQIREAEVDNQRGHGHPVGVKAAGSEGYYKDAFNMDLDLRPEAIAAYKIRVRMWMGRPRFSRIMGLNSSYPLRVESGYKVAKKIWYKYLWIGQKYLSIREWELGCNPANLSRLDDHPELMIIKSFIESFEDCIRTYEEPEGPKWRSQEYKEMTKRAKFRSDEYRKSAGIPVGKPALRHRSPNSKRLDGSHGPIDVG
jgi:hypothetical protein